MKMLSNYFTIALLCYSSLYAPSATEALLESQVDLATDLQDETTRGSKTEFVDSLYVKSLLATNTLQVSNGATITGGLTANGQLAVNGELTVNGAPVSTTSLSYAACHNNSSTQTVAANGGKVNFQYINKQNITVTGSNTFIMQKAGYYQIGYYVQANASSLLIVCAVAINGTIVGGSQYQSRVTTNPQVVFGGAATFLNVGDAIALVNVTAQDFVTTLTTSVNSSMEIIGISLS